MPRKSLTGPQVLSLLSSYPKSTESNELGVWNAEEFVGSDLKKGDEIELWPVETGFRHKDRGVLVQLDGREMVLERDLGEGGNGKIRIHAPRHGFRAKKLAEAKL